MVLNDFIKTALVQIAQGARDAETEFEKMGGAVNPKHVTGPGSYTYSEDNAPIRVNHVKFSLAISVSEGSESKKSGGASLRVVSGEVGKTTETIHSSVNKIEFEIPIVLPISKTNQNTNKKKMNFKTSVYPAK